MIVFILTVCRYLFIATIPLLCFFVTLPALAAPESYYQDRWCAGRGETEVVLPDRTRVDCLTPTHAIEIEFGRKWAEGIGQALYYSVQTGRRAGIVLILEKKKDYRYWIRLNTTIEHFGLPIDTWKAP